MYTVILVDDEKRIVDGLRKIIEREFSNCRVIGCAYDGMDGYELCMALQPDIVITDIRMLRIGGLKMIEMLQTDGFAAKYIILSGYSEFEYARKGMQLGINFYINKPVEEAELFQCMNKIIYEIDAERAQHKEVEGLKSKVERNMESLKEFVLRNILDDVGENVDDISYILDFIEFPISESQYICTIIEMFDSDNKYIAANLERIQSILQAEVNDWDGNVYVIEYTSELIAVIVANRHTITYRTYLEWITRIKLKIQSELGKTITIGIGLPYYRIEEINKSFEEAKHALNYKLIKGPDTIIRYDESEKGSTNTTLFEDDDIKKFEESLQNINYESSKQMIDDMFAKMASAEKLSWTDLQHQCLNIIFMAMQRILPPQSQLNEFISQQILGLAEISHFQTLDQLKDWLNGTIYSLIELKIASHVPSKNDVIEEIKDYMAKNFEKNISLADLSDRFYINLHYLSQLFKEKTGQTYLNYLMQLRVNQSKELLERSDLMVHEICHLVGYTDTQHFRKIFRKFVGDTPNAYRKKIRESQM